jgi:hypothetical protein
MGNVIDPNRKSTGNEQPKVDPDDPANVPRGYEVEKYEDYRGVTYSKDADLEAMYAKPKGESVDRLERRVHMNQRVEKATNWPAIIVLVVIFGGLAAFLGLSKRTIVDGLGQEKEVPLGMFLYKLANMTPRERELMNMSPDYRAFYITEERAQQIYDIASGQQAARETVMTPRQMAAARKIDPVQAMDCWGNEFKIDSTIGMIVRSPGPDGLSNTSDDLVIRDGKVQRPAAYQNQRMTSGAQ